jgi:hypothetical protein
LTENTEEKQAAALHREFGKFNKKQKKVDSRLDALYVHMNSKFTLMKNILDEGLT